jgi:Mn-dependent DtxR family transcriptional regulator
VMLGVHRPTVTVVLRALKREGLITSRYGRIRILKRNRLESRLVRMLQRHSRPFRATRAVTHVLRLESSDEQHI